MNKELGIMKKDFDKWNEIKKKTNGNESRFYTVREIWWCRLGVNVGFEQDGNSEFFLRPVVIIQSFGPNICAIIPLTKSKKKHKFRVPVGKVQEEEASAIISQMRVIDTRRFVEKVGFLNKEVFDELKKAIKGLL